MENFPKLSGHYIAELQHVDLLAGKSRLKLKAFDQDRVHSVQDRPCPIGNCKRLASILGCVPKAKKSPGAVIENVQNSRQYQRADNTVTIEGTIFGRRIM